MATTTQEAHEKIAAARQQLSTELDGLGAAARASVDIPAKIRRNPVRTLGLIGGAGFLAIGGPKRALKAVEKRVRPAPKDKLRGILPKDVEKLVVKSGASNADEVQARLEQDFYDWMAKRRTQPPANARQSLWRTYDTLLGPLGGMGSKALAKRLFSSEQSSKTTSIPSEKPKGDPKT